MKNEDIVFKNKNKSDEEVVRSGYLAEAPVNKEEQAASLKSLEAALADNVKYCLGEYTPDPSADYVVVIQKDGIYEVRENMLGKFVIKISKADFDGLPNMVEEGFTMKIPKIPREIFSKLLGFYQKIYDIYKSEVYVSVYYDPVGEEFKFYIPKQEVSPALVTYTDHTEEILEIEKKWIHVLETHSHNTMGGSFSGTDDKDQQECDVIHMVIGQIFNYNPSFTLRFAHGDYKVNVDINQIFDMKEVAENYNYDSLFPDWKKNITLSSRRPLGASLIGTTPGNRIRQIIQDIDNPEMTEEQIEQRRQAYAEPNLFDDIVLDDDEAYYEYNVYTNWENP